LARGVRDWGWDGSGEWGGEDHGSGETEDMGGTGGVSGRPSCLYNRRRPRADGDAVKGSGGLQSKAEGARHVHWWRVGGKAQHSGGVPRAPTAFRL